MPDVGATNIDAGRNSVNNPRQPPREMVCPPAGEVALPVATDRDYPAREVPMNNVKLPLSGGCQCGALRYEVSAAPLMIYACHCTTCQTQTGSAFVVSATVAEDALTFTSGEPQRIEWSAASGNGRVGLFCGACGTRIANAGVPSIGIYSLRAGTLDDTSWVRPAGHTWMKSAQPWFRPDPDDVVTDEQPTDYAPFVLRFSTFQSFSD